MSPMTSKIAGICLLVAIVTSAPLDKSAMSQVPASKTHAETPAQEVNHQDEDLQDLLQLINSQAHKENVMVHKEKVTHFENNNGKTLKINQEEEKVLATKTGDVLADVKQQVIQNTADSQNKPETAIETKIDIPSQGIHKTFLQDSDTEKNPSSESEQAPIQSMPTADEQTQADKKDALEGESEVSPIDMAEYLYYTQQFDAFFAGLDKLVNQSKLSAQDAASYARAVAAEYERIQMEEQAFFTEAQAYPGVRAYPKTSYGYQQLGYPRQQRNSQSEDVYLAAQADIDPYEFLAALWAEAYGNGNPEAKEIVQILYDRVSHDDNPDDMAQIRDILMETAASSLGDIALDPLSQQTSETESAPSQALDASMSESEESKEYKLANLEKAATDDEVKVNDDMVGAGEPDSDNNSQNVAQEQPAETTTVTSQ